jgi:hypothetical protein
MSSLNYFNLVEMLLTDVFTIGLDMVERSKVLIISTIAQGCNSLSIQSKTCHIFILLGESHSLALYFTSLFRFKGDNLRCIVSIGLKFE